MLSSAFHQLLDDGYYPQAERLLQSFVSATNETEINIVLLKARYYIDTGEFDTAIKILSQFIVETDDTTERLQAFLPYIDAIAHANDGKGAVGILEQLSETTWQELDNGDRLQFEYNRLWMYTTIILGQFDKAKQIADDIYELVNQLDDEAIYSKYYMQIARIYDYQGSLLPAIKNYKKAMGYGKKAGVLLDYLDPLHNISNIYQYQGKYKLAVAGYEEELDYLKRMGFDFYHYVTLGDLGWSYFLQGKDEQALELLMKAQEFLEDYQASENAVFRAEVITRIIIIALYTHADLDIKPYITKLEEINSRTNSPRVEIYSKVAEATRLKLSNTFRNLGKAMIIFEEIINWEKVIDIEFTLYAYLAMVNILFQNYSYAENPEILEDIESWIDRLYEFAEQQQSPSMSFQADWIRAKVKLAKGDRQGALKLLTTVLRESDKLGFEHIANQVTSEINHIDDDLKRSIDQTDFAYFRHDLTRQMLFSGQIQGVEEPQLFFIMGGSGMTLYTKHFDGDLSINENLISSFVNAIESFGSEAMAHKEVLNQIQYQENKILIEPKEHISLVFVIKGQTYPGLKKLLEFSNALELPKYRHIFSTHTTHIDDKSKQLLDQLFDSIFVY